MTRGRGRTSTNRASKSLGRGNFATRGNMPTVPKFTRSPQQGGMISSDGPNHISQVQTSPPSSTPLMVPIQASDHDLTRDGGRTITNCVSRSLGRSDFSTRGNTPTVPIIRSSSQQGGTSSSGELNHINHVQTARSSTPPLLPIQTSNHGITSPIHLEQSPGTPNQRNTASGGTSSQNNIIGDQVESSSTNRLRTLVTLSANGLEPSGDCSSFIFDSFKNELDPEGINWKSVSREMKEFYFGEFKKAFYWDSSIDTIVEKEWNRKAAKRYSAFVSKVKNNQIKLDRIPENVLNNWKTLWADDKCVEKSRINAKNRRRGGDGPASGTHTGGSITIGEHRKRIAVEKGRDPTPSEIHLHVHTHGNDGKSFVAARSKMVHEKYQEILQQQTQTQSDIDQFQAYFEAAGGKQKNRVYGLGPQGSSYFRPNFLNSAASDASPSAAPSTAQSIPIGNLEEFMTRLIPALTEHMLPSLAERVRELISSAPAAPTTAHTDEVHASISDNERNSPTSH